MTSHDSRWLWDQWIDLWNCDIELATDIIHPDFVVHRIPPPRVPDQLRGREALLAWIEHTRLAQDSAARYAEPLPLLPATPERGRLRFVTRRTSAG